MNDYKYILICMVKILSQEPLSQKEIKTINKIEKHIQEQLDVYYQ